MAYIGKTPTQAVRERFIYTAAGGETSLSGADDNSKVLVFADGEYVDVALNGVTLVAGTDYNTTTTNTIGGLVALVASDVVEVMVYDVFSVANLSDYFTTARVPFLRYDSSITNVPLSADKKVPFTRYDSTASNVALTN